VEFRLLGPFDVLIDGRTAQLGGSKQRTLLAILAIHANEVVSTDRLIEALWPEGAPESAANTLQGYVSRLRKTLDPGRSNGAEATIAFRSGGYVLMARAEQIDSSRFERLVQEADARAATGDGSAAARLLREALSLWRGTALSDFTYEDFARPEVARLAELRLKAIEDRIDADFACGHQDALVPELEGLVAEHPLRERLRAQLMLALYRCGRQAEALAAYREARTMLNGELGVEPTRALSELERAILQQDPSLDGRKYSWAVPATRPGRPRVQAAAAAAAAVAAAAALAVAFWPRAGDHAVTVRNNSVAVVDARTNQVVDDIVTGDYPGPLAAGDGHVWVGNTGDNTMMAIDAKTRKPGFAVAIQQPLDLAATGNRLWIANGTSFATGSPSGGGTIQCRGCRFGTNVMIKVGPPDQGNESHASVASNGRSVWAGDGPSRTVFGLDPATGAIVKRVRDVDASAIAIGYGSVWAAEPRRAAVARIDERTARLIERIPVPGDPTKIAAGAGGIWVTAPHPQSAVSRPRSAVWRIDPKTNKTVAVIAVPPTARRIAVGAGYVWVTSGTYHGEPGVPATGGSLSKIDPDTNRINATIKLGFRPDGVVVADGLVWVAVAPR
jgi:DNA-binding SARP family transcriptional activator